MDNNSSSNNDDLLERAFAAIQQGKSEESPLEAAASFRQARELLLRLSLASSSSPTKTDQEEEQRKIVRLYQEQSCEYMNRARQAFLEGLQEEHAKDLEAHQRNGDQKPFQYASQKLSDQDATHRIELFSSIFAKEMDPVAVASEKEKEGAETATTDNNNNNNNNGDELTLEERMQRLTASLPKSLRSSDQRLQDINQGMDRLGISLPVAPLTFKPRKSSSQQVEDIIAQAKDEVAMEQVFGGGGGANNNNDIDNNSPSASIESDNDSLMSDDDSLLSDEEAILQNVSQIHEQVAEAQAKLAELSAMLDSLPSSEEASKEDGSSNEEPTAFDPSYGKQKLQDAKQSIRKALRLWKLKAVQK